MALGGKTFARIRNSIPAAARDPLELFLAKNSMLATTGWSRSRRDLASVDAEGRPIPWITYPAIRFLEPRIEATFNVFEFGSGLSTLWWAERAASITSVEHDREWHERIAAKAPASARLLLEEGDGYVQAASGQTYDVIVIDGIRRPECARHAIGSLGSAAILLWDNTDEVADRAGHDFMRESSFRRLDFWGLGPLMVHESCTTIFYRPGNCLGI
jgi:hypothetical protein